MKANMAVITVDLCYAVYGHDNDENHGRLSTRTNQSRKDNTDTYATKYLLLNLQVFFGMFGYAMSQYRILCSGEVEACMAYASHKQEGCSINSYKMAPFNEFLK